jgi:hypothetical protein
LDRGGQQLFSRLRIFPRGCETAMLHVLSLKSLEALLDRGARQLFSRLRTFPRDYEIAMRLGLFLRNLVAELLYVCVVP